MRIQSSILAILMLLPGLAGAAPLELADEQGAPAIIGKGSSSTTVSVAGGAAKVTVAASGSGAVHTRSGTVEGDGSFALPEFGIEVGGGAGNANATGADGATPAPSEALLPPSTGSSGHACRQLDLRSVDGATLAAFADPDQVEIMSADEICGGASSSAGMSELVEKNATLSTVLAGAGHRPADVVEVGARGDGRIVLVVSAD